MVGSLPDVITYAKLQVKIFRGCDLQGVEFPILPFWLEIAYSRPFLGVLGHISPNGVTSPTVLTPKRHFLTQKHVV